MYRSELIDEALRRIGLYCLDEDGIFEFSRIDRKTTFNSPLTIVPSVFINIFKKKKDEIDPNTVNFILKDFNF